MINNYSYDWPKKFESEKKSILEILGESVIKIEHIGSTSVPTLSAKPIIDIAILVEDISNPKVFTETLESIGYTYKPEMSSGERIFLRKGEPIEFHLSISESKYSFWQRQLLFRDYLINHKEALEEYQTIKQEALIGLEETDLEDLSKSEIYNTKKGPFIQKILILAQEESDHNGSTII
jgi:GrpB-like predicted nucleotidyltransferase (UPF0157 family)